MSIETQKFYRKPFEVEAVQVTEENKAEIAEWCDGSVVYDGEKASHVLVPMANGRPKPAFVGDWILWSRNNYRVYNPVAFENSFARVEEGEYDAVHANPNQRELFRDAGSGEFISQEEAEASPGTTVKETVG